MRTIEEIKETICADFMRNESVAELFGFTPGDSFTSHFSKVSVIGILFYIFAVAAWTLEKLFDTYKGEVDTKKRTFPVLLGEYTIDIPLLLLQEETEGEHYHPRLGWAYRQEVCCRQEKEYPLEAESR